MNELTWELEKIYEALQAPVFIDVYGTLFALRADGATVKVPQPTGDSEARFFRPNSHGLTKWVASNRKIYALLAKGAPHFISLAENSLRLFKVLPSYAPIFPISSPGNVSDKIGLTLNGHVAYVDLTTDSKRCLITNDGYCAAGWSTTEELYLVGMTKRKSLWGGEGHRRADSSVLKGALAGVVKRGVRLGNATVSGNQLAQLIPHYPVERHTRLVVECWLSAIAADDDTHLLIGGIHDRGFFEDAWLLGSLPTDSDYSVIGAYIWRDSVLQLATAWYPYRFLQAIQTMNGALVYLTKCDKASGTGVKTLRAARYVGRAIASDLLEVHIKDADSPYLVSFLDFHFDSRVGFYGSISFMRAAWDHISRFVRSDDGLNWYVEHDLQR